MRKILLSAFTLILIPILAGCSGNTDITDVSIDYGTSELYTNADIDEAIRVMREAFDTFKGCELHALSYAGDERSEQELKYCLDTYEDKDYISCLVLDSSFRSPKKGGGAWNANTEYTWSWILARETGGGWILVNYGYG